MRFNIWLVVMVAVMPVFILFAGLSAAGGFASAVDWAILAALAGAGFTFAALARRNEDEHPETPPDDAASSDRA